VVRAAQSADAFLMNLSPRAGRSSSELRRFLSTHTCPPEAVESFEDCFGDHANLEPLFGTRDENLRLMEDSLGVRIDLRSDAVRVEGLEDGVMRVQRISGF